MGKKKFVDQFFFEFSRNYQRHREKTSGVGTRLYIRQDARVIIVVVSGRTKRKSRFFQLSKTAK